MRRIDGVLYRPFDLRDSQDRNLIRQFGWVRDTKGREYLITAITDECVIFEDTRITLDILLRDFTFLDSSPCGWRLAFGDQMIEELSQLLRKYSVEDYQILQIKEKYGGLRWYDNGFPRIGFDEYNTWVYKYEGLSLETCINCGNPAIGYTKGWITPLCEECMKDMEYDPIETDSNK